MIFEYSVLININVSSGWLTTEMETMGFFRAKSRPKITHDASVQEKHEHASTITIKREILLSIVTVCVVADDDVNRV